MLVPNNNTPTRNRKIGLPDEPVTPNGVPPLVEKMVSEQNPQLFSSGSQPHVQPPVSQSSQNVFSGGGVSGRFENPVNFARMQPQANHRLWEGAQQPRNANPSVGPVSTPYMNDAAAVTPQNVTNFEGMEKPSTGWKADGSARHDELSNALSGFQYVPHPERTPEFQKDESKRDGGFFGWLNGLMPKSRPGKRDGETDDEYDERTTRNKERLAVLADFMRHAGNIYNTSRYAPSQQFNDPTARMEADLQDRKARRRQREAVEQDAAYKQANLSLKERAAEADRQYKAMNIGFKQAAEERARKKADDDNKKWAANYGRLLGNDAYNQKMGEAKFKESQRHNKVSEGQGAMRIALSQERNQIARARLAHSIATGGGGGKAVSMANLSTPTGHINRKNDLSSIEKKQLVDYLMKNGYINEANKKAYANFKSLGQMQGANDLVNYWIGFAANTNGAKGVQFRKLLRDHYGYVETTATAQQPSKPKSVVTITSRGSKGAKPNAGNKGFKGHVD